MMFIPGSISLTILFAIAAGLVGLGYTWLIHRRKHEPINRTVYEVMWGFGLVAGATGVHYEWAWLPENMNGLYISVLFIYYAGVMGLPQFVMADRRDAERARQNQRDEETIDDAFSGE